jgi:hypothetical protein
MNISIGNLDNIIYRVIFPILETIGQKIHFLARKFWDIIRPLYSKHSWTRVNPFVAVEIMS